MVSPTLNVTLGLSQSIFESRNLLSDLQEQLATGKKVKTYGDLGIVRNQVLSLQAEIAQIGAYQKVGTQASIRMDVMVQSLERMQELASGTRSDAMLTGFELQASGQTVYQKEVGARLDEVVSLLNAEAGGRQLFSGRETETPPVVGPDVMLDGTGGQAGFQQIVDERRQADLGADGLGRLVMRGPEAMMLGAAVADPADIGGAATAEFTIDIGGNVQTFDVSDGGFDDLASLEAAIDAAFGGDVASIVNGNQLRLAAPNVTDPITVNDVDAGASALAGLTDGAVANPDTSVTLAEDFAGSPFGFKLAEVNSQLTGATVTGPGGGPPPELDVQFSATLPQDGDTIRIGFTLPDGTTQDLTLTARTDGPVGENEFLIGADETETAMNFQAALTTAIGDEAQRSLSAASLFAASNDFFDFDAANPPQRVDGPPFDTATALVDGTEANTVFWYKGEDSATPARTSAVAKVDDAVTTAYGARANEDAMRDVVKYFAAIAVETFDVNDPNAQERYGEMTQRAAAGLSFNGSQSLDDVITEIAVAKTTVDRASERHETTESLLQGFIDEEVTADVYEVSAAILQLQNRLQASLQVTAVINRLSLVNFI